MAVPLSDSARARGVTVMLRSPLPRLRRMALALPDAWEKLSHGEPTFWVGQRMFASFANAANHHGAGRHAVWCKAAHVMVHRHLRGKRELVQANGEPLTMKIVQNRVARAARAAGVRPGVHILRHTFCSHLAMQGAPARAIQELAGHKDLKTTQRYMHLSPAAIEGAIRLLNASRTGTPFGNMLATGSTEIGNSSR